MSWSETILEKNSSRQTRLGQIGYGAEHLKTARVDRGRERVRTREGDRPLNFTDGTAW